MPRPRFRFRLRTLFVAVTIVGTAAMLARFYRSDSIIIALIVGTLFAIRLPEIIRSLRGRPPRFGV